MEHPKATTFDCYGTLVDWETGIKSSLRAILLGKGVRADLNALYRAREDIEFDLIQGEYQSYRDILSLSLKRAFSALSIPFSRLDGERLVESVPSWPVYAETKPALERLSSTSKLVIISNVDNDIIAKTRDRIGVKFDFIVTAQDAGAYKPSITPFQLALEKLKLKPNEILHVSSGFKYDIPPARQLGFRTAWVNRKREEPPNELEPDVEFENLAELVESLA